MYRPKQARVAPNSGHWMYNTTSRLIHIDLYLQQAMRRILNTADTGKKRVVKIYVTDQGAERLFIFNKVSNDMQPCSREEGMSD